MTSGALVVVLLTPLSGCSSKTSGESCDLGLGDYTQEICDQAAQAAGCQSHELVQREEAMCSPPQTRTRNCCEYHDCGSLPNLPSPQGPNCSPFSDAGP
jgi:hypothetical protein